MDNWYDDNDEAHVRIRINYEKRRLQNNYCYCNCCKKWRTYKQFRAVVARLCVNRQKGQRTRRLAREGACEIRKIILETDENVVKMTFLKGAVLKDPSGLFNSILDGIVRRAINIHENGNIDEAALKALVSAAFEQNLKGIIYLPLSSNPRLSA